MIYPGKETSLLDCSFSHPRSICHTTRVHEKREQCTLVLKVSKDVQKLSRKVLGSEGFFRYTAGARIGGILGGAAGAISGAVMGGSAAGAVAALGK
jgi:hypothetical protein